MASKKRKTTKFECSCYMYVHENQNDCEEQRTEHKQIGITSRIILKSSVIVVLCGPNQKAFHVHRDLLALHSQYCQQALHSLSAMTPGKIALPLVSELQFACYLEWIHSSYLSVHFCDALGDNVYEELWMVAQELGDERFQNWCMNNIRRVTKESFKDNEEVHSVAQAKLVYQITNEGSPLRKYIADVLAHHSPFCGEDVEKHEEWAKLLRDTPELSLDMNRAAARNWNDTQPWDDEHRPSYMVPSMHIENRWDEQILARRIRNEVKIAADEGCLRSKFELGHLDRNVVGEQSDD